MRAVIPCVQFIAQAKTPSNSWLAIFQMHLQKPTGQAQSAWPVL
jgi:hypothetical protein